MADTCDILDGALPGAEVSGITSAETKFDRYSAALIFLDLNAVALWMLIIFSIFVGICYLAIAWFLYMLFMINIFP